MQGLLLRLSALDTGAESAVRVIAYFDSLVRDHVGVATLLQATATLAQCPVGLFDASTGRRWRAIPGRRATAERESAAQGPAAARGSAHAQVSSPSPGAVDIQGAGPSKGLVEVRDAGHSRGPVDVQAAGPSKGLVEVEGAGPSKGLVEVEGAGHSRGAVDVPPKGLVEVEGAGRSPGPVDAPESGSSPGTGSGRGPDLAPTFRGGPEPGRQTGAGPLTRELGAGLGTVWMEREGDPHGLDEIVLERLAVAAEVTLERAAPAADPALVELALSADTGEPENARALRLLGFDAGVPLQVLAAPAACRSALMAGLRADGLHARSAAVGELAVVIVTAEVADLPPAVRAGVGPPVSPAKLVESWEAARLALRFTGDGARDRVVRWADLGALALLAAHVPDAAVAALPDVRAVRSLPPEVAAAVRALCEEGSVRRAAAAAHLHHSSMAARIARAEVALGFPLAAPAGRLRAHLALSLARLVT
ncbi:helix-turn-helix domain-containing protein [Nonomuraea sp. NPDC003804]|uniref:helix-turn-helix domain-containing protein n=1 Tax=Nonomuraea sp. NPDC003804 TaxID=3154547 RepID=UPI0033A951A0